MKIGARASVVVGSSLLCLGTISSAFVTEFKYLYITMGVINGRLIGGRGVIYLNFYPLLFDGLSSPQKNKA